MTYDFTVIVPVYNEADSLKPLEQELLAYIQVATLPTCILFVNDGSTDASMATIEALCSKNKDFKYISLNKNYGLSTALKAGFDHVDTPWLGYLDADLQTTPEDFNLLLKHKDDYDLITGVRTDRKDSIIKKASTKVANSFRRLFTQDGMDDTGCPLKIIRSDYAKRIPMFKGLHRFLPAMILLQHGKILQIPVRHFPRRAGRSKFGFWNRSFGPFIDCFAYLWMKRKYILYNLEQRNH